MNFSNKPSHRYVNFEKKRKIFFMCLNHLHYHHYNNDKAYENLICAATFYLH